VQAEPSPAQTSDSATPRWELVVYGLLLAWFAARLVYLAVWMHPYVPPDETTHFGRVLAYAKVWGVPANGPADFEYGLLDHRPWLYYWVMARSLALNFLPIPNLVFLRLLNGAMGLATVVLATLWVREWFRSPWARVLFVAIVSNTLMLTGLFASVSYDNGANLLAAASVLAFTRFRRSRRVTWLLSFGALVLAGCLTKRTFLPLGFLLVLWMVFRERAHLSDLPGRAAAAWRDARPRTWVLAGTLLVLLGFTLSLYGGNFLHYGKLRPGFDQVVGEENAMQNRVFARSRILEQFQAGDISIDEARGRAARIRHRGDRGDTLFLLKTAQLPESTVKGRIPYLADWGWGMLKSAAGYLGHRRAEKGDAFLWGYLAIFALAAVVALGRWRPGAARGVPADAGFLVLGYAFVLIFFVNYPNYQVSRYVELALQGRYLFPVIVPFLALVAWSLAELAPEKARPWLAVGVAAFFLYGDFPWFVQQLQERWLMPR
jgi:hypothetical protein